MKRLFFLFFVVLLGCESAQSESSWKQLPQEHPRYLNVGKSKSATLRLLKKEAWAQEVFTKLQQRTDVYVNKGPEWLSDRLQMHWNTHATEIYIQGEFYSHCGGTKAPVPTVMMSGSRGHATDYVRPKLEELQPRQEDSRGLWLRNGKLNGKPTDTCKFRYFFYCHHSVCQKCGIRMVAHRREKICRMCGIGIRHLHERHLLPERSLRPQSRTSANLDRYAVV